MMSAVPEQEQEYLIGSTLIRYQDQKKRLACLETKASNIRHPVNAVK